MIYISLGSILLIILSISNFLNIKFKIKINETYFVSCSIIILLSYWSYLLSIYYNKDYLIYSYYLLNIFAFIVALYLIKNFSKIDQKFNIEFIIFFLLIFYFSKDKYFLDQDELTYWGYSIKELFTNSIFFENGYRRYHHHPPGLTLFQYLFVFIKYQEGMIIFANNVLLITAYFYLFYDNKFSRIEKFFIFLLYYLLINNLSFGFMSAYSDPILGVFFSCILKLCYAFIIPKEKNNHIINTSSKIEFLFILALFVLTFLLFNRSSPIYILFSIFFIFSFMNLRSFKKFSSYNYKILLIIIFSFFIYYCFYFFLNRILHGNYLLTDIVLNLKLFITENFFSALYLKIFTSPIYFSSFGVTFNTILDFLFSKNDIFPEFQISVITYIFLLSLLIFFISANKFTLLTTSLFSIFIYSIIIFILKIQMENLSIIAVQRYLGIQLLGIFIFIIFILANENQGSFNKGLFLLMIILITVTPKKTIGFFMPDKIYYSNSINLKFKNNREQIKKIRMLKNDYIKIFFIHKNMMSDFTKSDSSGEHSFYHDIIFYELYPNYFTILEFDKFNSFFDSLQTQEKESLFIFFDIPPNDLSKVYGSLKNYLIINTYRIN